MNIVEEAISWGRQFAGESAGYERTRSFPSAYGDNGCRKGLPNLSNSDSARSVSASWCPVVYPGREKSFRKDEIKLVTETEGNAFRIAGLKISKYGRFGTWLWGCIL